MRNQVMQVGNMCPTKTRSNPNQGRVYDPDGIAPTLNCMGGGNQEPRVIIYDDYNGRVKADQTCIGTITTNIGASAIRNGTKLIEKCGDNMSTDEITMIGGLQKHQTPRTDGICPCINSAAGMGGGQTPIAIRPHYKVRKLTQKECWRLMGFDDQDFEKAKSAMNENIYNGKDRSGSQLYKQAGNSIVVDVLSAIMKNLHSSMPYLFDDIEVGSFFSGIGAFEKALKEFDTTPPATVQGQ